MRFMHVSDVHLGAKPDAGKPWGAKRAQDIWNSFSEAIDRAAEEEVEFLFLSGDLFHGQPLKKELKEVNYLFEKIPDTRVILMAGNHDFMHPKSYYRSFEWADNVYFFEREEVDCFDFPEENICIYGMSYWHREIREALYDNILPKNQKRINILLAHGGDEKHIPFSPSRILQNGFDYIASGHIHKGGQMVEGKVVMAGALEPLDYTDPGPHGYWIGELKKGEACNNLQFISVKKCEYRQEIVSVTAKDSERKLLEAMKEILRQAPEYQYIRFVLEGYSDPDMSYDFTELEGLGRVVGVVNQLVPDYNYEKLLLENPGTLLGNYIRRMNGMEQNSIRDKALEYGVNALLGHQICR